MKYIEQQLTVKNYKKLWYYLPFTVFFLGIMFFNWIYIQFGDVSTKELINKQIELLGKNLNFLSVLLPFVFLLLFLIGWVVLVHKQSILSLVTGRSRVDFKRILFAFSVQSLFVIGGFLISYYLHPEHYVFNFEASKFFVFLAITVLFVPIQTSFEELFMRGYLLQGIGIASKSKALALIFTSLIFGLLHASNPEMEQLGSIMMIYYIGSGLFLGAITLMDDGLELALGYHAANNMVGALLATSTWTAFQTNSLFLDISPVEHIGISDFILQIVVVLPMMFFIFYKKYNWSNMKERLFGKVKG